MVACLETGLLPYCKHGFIHTGIVVMASGFEGVWITEVLKSRSDFRLNLSLVTVRDRWHRNVCQQTSLASACAGGLPSSGAYNGQDGTVQEFQEL